MIGESASEGGARPGRWGGGARQARRSPPPHWLWRDRREPGREGWGTGRGRGYLRARGARGGRRGANGRASRARAWACGRVCGAGLLAGDKARYCPSLVLPGPQWLLEDRLTVLGSCGREGPAFQLRHYGSTRPLALSLWHPTLCSHWEALPTQPPHNSSIGGPSPRCVPSCRCPRVCLKFSSAKASGAMEVILFPLFALPFSCCVIQVGGIAQT